MKSICPWLTRDSIMNAYRKRVKQAPHVLLLENTPADTSSEIVAVPVYTETVLSIIVRRGGRPKGTINKRKEIAALSLYAAKNEIVELFETEMKQCQTAKKGMKKGRLLKIIDEVKIQNNLSNEIEPTLIRQRFKRKKLFIVHPKVQMSPLLPIDPTVVNVIIQLA